MIKRVIFAILVLLIISVLVFNYTKSFDKFFKTKELETKTVDDRPKNEEPYKESKIIKSDVADNESEYELKYDEYVVANGYVGASDNAYFTRNKVLYHIVISTNQITKIAEGVRKIENDKDSLTAYKGENFKIVKEDDYVFYVD